MNNPALTHNDLNAYIGSYRDGLIDGHELVCITKACVRNEPTPVWTPLIEASETLHVAFTAAGIQALLTRIQGSREIAEEMLTSAWSVNADGKKLSARLVLHGDLAPANRDANDHEWIMPRIEKGHFFLSPCSKAFASNTLSSGFMNRAAGIAIITRKNPKTYQSKKCCFNPLLSAIIAGMAASPEAISR